MGNTIVMIANSSSVEEHDTSAYYNVNVPNLTRHNDKTDEDFSVPDITFRDMAGFEEHNLVVVKTRVASSEYIDLTENTPSQLFREKCHITNKITDLQKFISDQSDNDPDLKELLLQLNDRIMSGYPDDNDDNIAYVVDRLYTPEQLDLYYNNNKEKVDVRKYVLDFTDQIINMIQS